jgi:NADH-quinone oxidoreductase subunit F
MFVSGESTALMSGVEGKIGEPRSKYIHTVVKGLYEKPADLNNVETWMNIPPIISNGAGWFKSIGTASSKGTKVFSLVGKVNNVGLVEVPMGTTLKDIIYNVGDGVQNGKRLKAVQVGGPGGGFIPEEMLNVQVDFDEMAKADIPMILGSIVVLDEDTCIIDLTRYFAEFLSEESCGKCIPCREGLRVISEILNDTCEGKGKEDDAEIIDDIADTMKEATLCALGSTAVNPVLTTMKYFRDEWEQHIIEKRCPANVCKALIDFYINPEKCQACLLCLKECPAGAIQGDKDQVNWIDQEKCIKCGTCYEICSFHAVKKLSGEPIPPPPKGMKPIRKLKGEN